MLRRLYIENFALVEKLEVEFGPGMNALTGETGAGKSIIVGAVAQLLGERAEKEDVRTGAKMSVIEGDFDISGREEIQQGLTQIGISTGEVISIRREIQSRGSSRILVDSQVVSLNQLRQIMSSLADLFGQHSHQQLLDEQNHLQFLDRFAGISGRADELGETFRQWQASSREYVALLTGREQDKTERELLQYQKDEIEKAAIRIGEDEKLLAERKILDASVMLGEKSEKILELLDRDENSVSNLMNVCRKELGHMASADSRLNVLQELLETALLNFDELREEMERYHESIPEDPERLEEINHRLDLIFRLKKKYGGSEDSILATLEQISTRLSSTVDVEARLRELEKEKGEMQEKYCREALALSTIRKEASGRLSRKVEKELTSLGFDQAKFELEFLYDADPEGILLDGRSIKAYPQGLENGRFLVTANPGEPLKPLVKTASGGELSRIMLALMAANLPEKRKNRRLLVFDEVDAGIGGETARAVGKKLAALAEYYQLIVVTHLHQIASFASEHYAVEKIEASSSRRKTVSVRKLSKPERDKEIKRMVSLPEEEPSGKSSRQETRRK